MSAALLASPSARVVAFQPNPPWAHPFLDPCFHLPTARWGSVTSRSCSNSGIHSMFNDNQSCFFQSKPFTGNRLKREFFGHAPSGFETDDSPAFQGIRRHRNNILQASNSKTAFRIDSYAGDTKQSEVDEENYSEEDFVTNFAEDEDDDFSDSEELTFSEKEMDEEASKFANFYKQKLLSELLDEDDQDVEKEDAKKKGKKGRKIKQQYDTNVPDHLLPKVAIIGRPNVGKSALFNRIAGRDIAIVYDEPGVTRDRQYAKAFWGKKFFQITDTGGVLTVSSSQKFGSDALAIASARGSESIAKALKESAEAGLPSLIEKQAMEAVEEAHAIIFVVDGQAGLTAADLEISSWLRKKYSHKKITLAVNKCESATKGYSQITDFYSLGFDPIPVSAISGTGSGDLLDEVTSLLPSPEELEESYDVEKPLSIAIIGRPNVGKSSILNSLIGKERSIISPISGTTRDSIDTFFEGSDGRSYCLIDTAGIRKRSSVMSGKVKTEILSVNRAMRAIRRADVVVLVIEAMQCVTEQDYRLAERVEKEGKACVIVINKWDTIPEKDSNTILTYEQDVRDRLTNIPWAPIVYTSAINGQRINKILEAARKAGDERAKRIPTSVLNTVVRESFFFQKPSIGKGGKRGKIYYCTQAAVRPPTFVFFVNDSKLFPEVYRRYMEKQIRQNIGFPGTPIRLLWRSKKKTESEKISKENKE